MTWPQRVLYRTIRTLVRTVSDLLFAITVEGSEHVPAEGTFVLAPVHRSNVDFALASLVTKRRMRFMAKDSLFKVPGLAQFITALGAYPVNRGTADRDALRRTEECLKRGEPVVMFPEGTRKSGPVVENVFEGVSFVAARNGVPVIPVGIGGSERAMPKGARMIHPVRIHLVVGEPIYPDWSLDKGRPPRRVVHTLSEQVHTALQDVFDRAEARVGGNRNLH